MIARQPTLTIDSIHWTIPIAVGFWDGNNGNRYYDFIKESEADDPIKKFLDFLRIHIDEYEKISIASSDGAKWTHKFILDELQKTDEKVSPNFGNKLLTWEVEKPSNRQKPVYKKIHFIDSSNLLRGWDTDKILSVLDDKEMKILLGDDIYRSLDTQTSPPRIPETWKHEKTKAPWEMGDELPTFRAYLKEDTLKLSEAMSRFQLFFLGGLGSPTTVTFATSNHKFLYDKFLTDIKIDPNMKWEDTIREGIYGARNEVYKRYGENIHAYDIHWMFGSCYDVPVPIGPMEVMLHSRWSLENGTLARATVHVPEDLYTGPLPYRGGARKPLIFPVGIFTDTWDMYELRNAVENWGVKVLKFHLMWECEEKVILKEFLDYMKRFVQRHPELGIFVKEIVISPSGKFGQRREGSKYVHWKELTNKDSEFLIPVGDTENYFEQFTINNSPRIVPAITMRIRAVARIRHLNLIKEALDLGEEVFYCDNDSLYTTAELPYTKLEVGKPRIVEEGIQRGYFIRQKLYATVDKCGRFQQKSAGYSDVKLTEEDFKNLLNGAEVEVGTISKAQGLRELLKGKELELLDRVQYLTANSTDTRINEGDNTRPIVLKEPIP